jgi:hypothetical protein
MKPESQKRPFGMWLWWCCCRRFVRCRLPLSKFVTHKYRHFRFCLIALSFFSNMRCVFAVTINLRDRLSSSIIYTIDCHGSSLEYSIGVWEGQMRGMGGARGTSLDFPSCLIAFQERLSDAWICYTKAGRLIIRYF